MKSSVVGQNLGNHIFGQNIGRDHITVKRDDPAPQPGYGTVGIPIGGNNHISSHQNTPWRINLKTGPIRTNSSHRCMTDYLRTGRPCSVQQPQMVEPGMNTPEVWNQRSPDITTGPNLVALLRFRDHLKRVTEMFASQLEFIGHQYPLLGIQGAHEPATARQVTVYVLPRYQFEHKIKRGIEFPVHLHCVAKTIGL